jgi:hypothetical protein
VCTLRFRAAGKEQHGPNPFSSQGFHLKISPGGRDTFSLLGDVPRQLRDKACHCLGLPAQGNLDIEGIVQGVEKGISLDPEASIREFLDGFLFSLFILVVHFPTISSSTSS